ncbi:MAG: alkaline phosphatase D family protein [Saprospiraceae bacterium]
MSVLSRLILATLFISFFSCKTVEKESNGKDGFILKQTVSFDHGVASGDPTSNAIILWTRITTDGSAEGKWEISKDQKFNSIEQNGHFFTDNNADYTVKIDVKNLDINTAYYYRFKSYGVISPVGKTKTLDNSGVGEVSLGIVSCSNFQFGYFSAYRHLAQKNIDIVLHLGDYFYEHGPEGYGDAEFERKHDPPHELLTLQDYRTRYAQYRSDEDLKLIHQNHPFIAIWDDHEISNDAYKDGAQNHQKEEGDYMQRTAFAKKAYYEWMPIRSNEKNVLYRDFNLGPLADIIVLDERLIGKTKPVEKPEEVGAEQSMLGPEQLLWFKKKMSDSDATWKIIGNQVIFSHLKLGKVRPTAPLNLDAWDGYAVERDDIIDHIDQNNIENVVFVTGDTHTSWAFEIPKSISNYQETGSAVGIEFGTPSITSSNWNDTGRSDELVKGAEQLIKSDNPHLKYVNGRDHGYMILKLTKEEARVDWYFVNNIKEKDSGEKWAKSMRVKKGTTKILED